MSRKAIRARRLRKDSTDAERLLWSRLRGRQVNGHKFRRQHPIGTYVVDFACVEADLLIELDGGQHGEIVDAERIAWLQGEGFKVLRFWNNEVLDNADGVLTAIEQALQQR